MQRGVTVNATYLFEKPLRKFHHSESWWTAWFAMLLIWGNKNNRPVTLPAYCIKDGLPVEHRKNACFAGATYGTLVAEAPISGEIFSIDAFPDEYFNLRPDLTFIKRGGERFVAFVEVKTIGSGIRRNIALYDGLGNYLNGAGWAVDFYYLLSRGHEQPAELKLLEDTSARIIFWEDVFAYAENTPYGDLFEDSLAQYCDNE